MIETKFDEAEIDKIFAAIDQSRLPGAAVGIAIGGVPVYRKGFGLANLELPTLLTPSMRMRIGSTTKHFACLAYLLLCEEGKAGLDDAIGRHIPDLPAPAAQATMRQLMGHTSGIRDLLSVTMAMHGPNRPVTDKEMLAYYRTIDTIDFAAGTRWSYNNGAYMLLTAAIEAITGQSLDDVLRERILTPVGMHDTMLRRWDQDFVPNSATLHNRDAAGNWTRVYMGMEISGAGGMVSTMDDMLRWLKHMDAPVVGTAETWALMRAPHTLANGQSTGYGLALITETYRGVDIVHHAGGVMGGNSQMIKVPAAGLDISIACNRADISGVALALEVIDKVVQGLDPVPEKIDFEKRTGTYRSAATGRIVRLSVADDNQMMSVDGAPPVPIVADAEGVRRPPAAMAFMQQTFRIEGDDIVFVDFGNEERMTPIATADDATIGDRAGSYRSDELDATLTIAGDGAMISRGRHGATDYKLEPITADIWRADLLAFPGLAGIVTFDADGRGLSLDFTRMRHVRFTRTA